MMKRQSLGLLALAPLAFFGLAGCSDDGADDAALDTNGGSCTVEDRNDGSVVIRCPDGSEAVVHDGRTGAPGRDGERGRNGLDGANGKDGKDGKDVESPCVLTDNPDGTHSLTCGDQSVVIGAPCDHGYPYSLLVTDSGAPESTNLMLFQVTSCTWVRGDVVVTSFAGEQLPVALSRIVKVDGHVVVGGDVDVEDNEGLLRVAMPALKTVGGDLTVINNPTLLETSFPALESVDGSLSWGFNEALHSVGEFPELARVGGVFGFMGNPNLEETPSFPELTTVDHNLGFVMNDALTTIGAFPKLSKVGWYLVWHSNPMLTETPEFPALTSIGEGLEDAWTEKVLHWADNAALETIGSFPALVTVGASIGWEGNESLVTIGDFPALETVSGEIVFQDNEALEEIGSFEKLESVKNLDFVGNASLTALPKFEALTTIDGNLSIIDNVALASIDGFESLAVIDGDLTIANNDELVSIDGLANLTSVGGDFTVANNAKLQTCDIYDLVEKIKVADGVGGIVIVEDNDDTDDSCFPDN